ncbi:MAG: hypothetical protein R3E89_10645 [Thiolinea sp.]
MKGKLYAVAMSPDGEQVAVAGWTGQWDVKWIPSIFSSAAAAPCSPASVICPMSLTTSPFSPDGGKLAVALGGGNGIRLFATRDWRELARDL